jgi:acyl-CoA thioesterase-1
MTFSAFSAHAMARIGFVLTIILAAAFPATVRSVTPAEPIVMVYGDSLSAAYGLKPQEGWVSLMQQRLKSDGIPVAIVNASISGETTSGGVSRIGADLAKHKPTVVVIALGANDGLRGLPVAQMQRNLETMLSAVSQSGARAILVGIQIPPNYGIEYANDFKSAFATIAQRRKIPLVPFLLDGIADNLDNFQADRLHPIAAAQPRILQNVLPTVLKTLQRVAAPQTTKANAVTTP